MSAPSVHRHPAWFGAVMGTGATALVILGQAGTWEAAWLKPVAVLFLLLASIVAILLWPRHLRRLGDRGALAAELGDPAHGAMLATMPAGILVLAVAWGRVGPLIVPSTVALWIDIILLVIGTFVALAMGISWAGAIASGTFGLEAVNGGWLIPPVMNLLVPLALVPVITAYPDQAPWLLAIGFAFLGVGTVLFLAMFTLLIARLALRPPLPVPMTPSLWIPLAPAGVLGLSLLRLLQAGQAAGVEGFTSATAGVIVAAMGIGLGLWWALFAGVHLVRVQRAGGVPFHPGWWGFVFPIAAMALAVGAVGEAMDSVAIEGFGALAAVVLLIVWALVAVRSIGLVRRAPTR